MMDAAFVIAVSEADQAVTGTGPRRQ
jgi:hypothetical protein